MSAVRHVCNREHGHGASETRPGWHRIYMQTKTAEEIEKYSKRTVRVTKQHNDECKRLLVLLGVPIIEVRSWWQTLTLARHLQYPTKHDHLCCQLHVCSCRCGRRTSLECGTASMKHIPVTAH